MEMEKMIELIDAVSKSDLTGFKYEEDGIKLHLSKKENTCYVTENLSAPVNAVTTSAAEIKKAAEGDQISGTSAEEIPVGNVVESPLVGTFYAAPAEDAESFVKVGDRVEKGQTLGIVGESGCGKSTFMRMMVQLEQPTSGEILFKGKDITKMKGEELRKNRRNVQMVFQNPSTSFNPKMKVGDIICEPLMNFGLIKKKEKDAVARKYLEMVELPGDFVDRYPHNMSGGQRQRVGIARAIALEPEIIFL